MARTCEAGLVRQRSWGAGAWRVQLAVWLLVAGVSAALQSAAEPAAAAPAPATNAALDQVLGRLRGAAEAAVAAGLSNIEASSATSLRRFEHDADEEIEHGKPKHAEAIHDIAGPAKAALAAAKVEFTAARGEAAIRASLTARAEAEAVEREAEAEITALEKKATMLEAEGSGRLTDAETALSSLRTAIGEVQQWRAKWPRESIQNAIVLGNEAQKVAPAMQELAASSEATDEQLDRRAVGVLKTITEAMQHSQQAALIARSAIDQAEQNALKLQGIVELAQGADHAQRAAAATAAGLPAA